MGVGPRWSCSASTNPLPEAQPAEMQLSPVVWLNRPVKAHAPIDENLWPAMQLAVMPVGFKPTWLVFEGSVTTARGAGGERVVRSGSLLHMGFYWP
jgi:hypothetical protein